MDRKERIFLAEEILGNPLFNELVATLEKDAIDRALHAPIGEAQQAALADVRAARAFRGNCEAVLYNNPSEKPAPA